MKKDRNQPSVTHTRKTKKGTTTSRTPVKPVHHAARGKTYAVAGADSQEAKRRRARIKP